MKKKKRKRKLKKKYYIVRFFLLGAFCTCIYFFAMSSYFVVKTLTVRDNNHYTEEQIIAMAQIGEEENLFKLSSKEIKDKLVGDPYIKYAKISKKLPNEIIISVGERYEKACLPYGDDYIIIDEEGIVLRKTDREPALTKFVGMTLTKIEAGEDLEVEEASMLLNALDLIRKMEDHDIYFKRIGFHDSLMRAYIYDGLVCEGRPENILKSMDDLEDVLYDLYVQGVKRGTIKVGGNGYFSFSAVIE